MKERIVKRKQTPKGKVHLRVAIIVDPYGTSLMAKTGVDKVEEHKDDLTELLDCRALTFATPAVVDDKMEADLVLFDFGGMSLGNDLMADNSRRLIRWAQDHPSSLVVVVSMFTYRHGIFYEMRELGLVPDDAESPSPFDESAKSPLINIVTGSLNQRSEAIRKWFS